MTKADDLISVKIGQFITTEGEVLDYNTSVMRKSMGGSPSKTNIGIDFWTASKYHDIKGDLKKAIFDEGAVNKYSVEEVVCGSCSLTSIELVEGIDKFDCVETLIEEVELPYSVRIALVPWFCKVSNLYELFDHDPQINLEFK